MSILARIIILLPMLGAVMVYVAVEEKNAAGKMGTEPEVVSCAQLEYRGPSENHHITLTRFRPCSRGYRHVELGSGPDWQFAHIPVFSPRAGGEPNSRELRVILRVMARNEEQLYQVLAQRQLTGHIMAARFPRQRSREMLSELYPRLDYEKCYVISVGGDLPSLQNALFTQRVGIGLIAAGAASAILLVWRKVRASRRQRQERDRAAALDPAAADSYGDEFYPGELSATDPAWGPSRVRSSRVTLLLNMCIGLFLTSGAAAYFLHLIDEVAMVLVLAMGGLVKLSLRYVMTAASEIAAGGRHLRKEKRSV